MKSIETEGSLKHHENYRIQGSLKTPWKVQQPKEVLKHHEKYNIWRKSSDTMKSTKTEGSLKTSWKVQKFKGVLP